MADETVIAEGTEGRDLVDQLIDDLNDGVSGVTFDRDVLDTNRPDDWGAAELNGQNGGDWADGGMIDQTLGVDVWVCESNRGSGTKRAVQEVLRAYCAAHDGAWRFVKRAYLYDLDKVLWHWTVDVCGPLAEDEEEPDDEDEPDDTEEPDEPEDGEDLPLTDPEWPEPEDGE